MDFDKVRWKLADDLSPEEMKLIVDNKDKLNDEEKAAFADVILQGTPLSDDPLNDAINTAVDDQTNKDPNAAITDPDKNANNNHPQNQPDPANPNAAPVTPPVTSPPATANPFDTLDKYLEEKKKQWDAEGKTVTEQKQEEEKITKLYDEGYKPKDWNEFAVSYLDKAGAIIEKRILDKLDAQNKKFQEQQDQVKKTQQEIYQRFESEFKTLADSKLIPDPVASPDEYKKVHAAIIAIGDAHGKTTVTDAYKLWAIIPQEHGGGLKVGKTEQQNDPAEEEKQRIEQQKQAAGKIGSGRGTVGGGKKGTPNYGYIHGNRMEDLIDARLQQPN